MVRWKSDKWSRMATILWIAGITAVVFALGVSLVLSGAVKGGVLLGLAVSAWLIVATLADVWKKSRGQIGRISGLGWSYLGMVLAHVGVGITIIGVTMVANYSIEKSVRIAPGQVETLGDYQFEFVQAGTIEGPNYTSQATRFNLLKDGRVIEVLTAEKRRYHARNSIMTEAAIDASLWRDIYVSMGEPLAGGAWAMRLQVKPFMRWVWLGAIFMSLGGLLAVLDKRYRKQRHSEAKTAAKAQGAAS